MNSDQFARTIATSIARHQTRGLVDAATGLADVVIHGRVDLIAVADELLAASLLQAKPAKRSWSAWFMRDAECRKAQRRQAQKRERLAEQLAEGLTAAEAAIARLRMRDIA